MSSVKEFFIRDFSAAAVLDNFRINSRGELAKREGSVPFARFSASIRGAVVAKGALYVVAGDSLYLTEYMSTTLLGTLSACSFSSADEKVNIFHHNGVIYIFGGGTSYTYDTRSQIFSEMSGYYPVVSTADSEGVIEILNQPYNMLSSIVRARFRLSSSVTEYSLKGYVTRIIAVYCDGVPLTSGTAYIPYILTSGTAKVLTYPNQMPNKTGIMEVEYELMTKTHIPTPEAVFAYKKSYVYETENGAYLLLYNSDDTSGHFIYSNPQVSEESMYNGFDYYVNGHEFAVGNGKAAIRTFARLGDMTLVFCENEVYRLTHRIDSSGNIVFSTTLFSPSLGAGEFSGTVSFEGKLYVINKHGLFSIWWDIDNEEYVISKYDIPEYAANTADYSQMSLHLNESKDELWCTNGEYTAVYDIKRDIWCRFTRICGRLFLTAEKTTMFVSENYLNAMDDTATNDSGSIISAVYESPMIDFGNVFAKKTVFGVGLLFDRVSGAKFTCDLTSDKQSKFSFTLSPDSNSGLSPAVESSHVRLGNCAYIVCRITSATNVGAANIREIMLRYRIIGGAK